MPPRRRDMRTRSYVVLEASGKGRRRARRPGARPSCGCDAALPKCAGGDAHGVSIGRGCGLCRARGRRRAAIGGAAENATYAAMAALSFRSAVPVLCGGRTRRLRQRDACARIVATGDMRRRQSESREALSEQQDCEDGSEKLARRTGPSFPSLRPLDHGLPVILHRPALPSRRSVDDLHRGIYLRQVS